MSVLDDFKQQNGVMEAEPARKDKLLVNEEKECRKDLYVLERKAVIIKNV